MSLVKKIRIPDEHISVEKAYSFYNRDLNETIDSDFDRALLILHKDIPADHFLWEWALDWKSKFLECGKLLSILTSDKKQSDALNGVHLKSSKEPISNTVAHDLEQLYTNLSNQDTNPNEIKNNLSTINQIYNSHNKETPKLLIMPKSKFLITGEYICNSCGTKTVFVKGETALPCQEENCISPYDGWNLTVELF